jgi:hypothetical protein
VSERGEKVNFISFQFKNEPVKEVLGGGGKELDTSGARFLTIKFDEGSIEEYNKKKEILENAKKGDIIELEFDTLRSLEVVVSEGVKHIFTDGKECKILEGEIEGGDLNALEKYFHPRLRKKNGLPSLGIKKGDDLRELIGLLLAFRDHGFTFEVQKIFREAEPEV